MILRLDSDHENINIPTEPAATSPVVADMVELFGSTLTYEPTHAYPADASEWVAMNAEENVLAMYEPFDAATSIHVNELRLPGQRMRWAAVRLYAQMSGVPLENLCLEHVNPENLADVCGISYLFNPSRSSLVDVFDYALENIFTTHAERTALVGIVGAVDWLAFRETWKTAEELPTRFLGAKFLLDNAVRFS